MKLNNIHICLIYPGYPPETHAGGIGTYVYEIVQALSSFPIDISIISRSENFIDKTEKIKSNVILYRIGENSRAKTDNQLLFRNKGFTSHYKKILDKVYEINNKKKIDIIESCDWGAEGYLLLNDFYDKLIVKCHTPSFVSESYNINNNAYLSSEIKKKEQEFISSAKNIICPSISLIQEMQKYITLSGRIIIEPYPVSIDLILKKKNYSIDNSHMKLLTVGRVEERKGQDIIIKTIEKLSTKNIYTTLDIIGSDTVIGNGGFISNVFLSTVTKNIHSQINLYKEMKRREVLKKYLDYDLYIAASRFDNFPYTVLEAMCAGLPVIGNNNSGIKEQIRNNENGILFNGSSNDLYEKIIFLYKNKNLRENIGKSGIEYVNTNFSSKIVAIKILQNYINTINNN